MAVNSTRTHRAEIRGLLRSALAFLFYFYGYTKKRMQTRRKLGVRAHVCMCREKGVGVCGAGGIQDDFVDA